MKLSMPIDGPLANAPAPPVPPLVAGAGAVGAPVPFPVNPGVVLACAPKVTDGSGGGALPELEQPASSTAAAAVSAASAANAAPDRAERMRTMREDMTG